MKLSCHKCKRLLTESLVYVPLKFATFNGDRRLLNEKSIFDYFTYGSVENSDSYENDLYVERKMKKGIFFISRKRPAMMLRFKDDDMPGVIFNKINPMIVVGKKSILEGVIPPFKRGYGCCDYSMGEPLECSCGTHLGNMYLDCYEDENIEFIPEKVDRVY